MIVIRELRDSDAEDWRRLWTSYNEFYETILPAEVTAHTWSRLLASGSSMIGHVAEKDGRVVGFCNSVLHESSWTTTPSCYLEDLFVDPVFRGRGIARALIKNLINLGGARGWSRIYWHTRAGNTGARSLYDTFASADDFVRYRLRLK